MTKEDQIRFVSECTDRIRLAIVQQIADGKIPERWDGLELRELVADGGDNLRHMTKSHVRHPSKPDYRTRVLDYRNEILVRNL